MAPSPSTIPVVASATGLSPPVVVFCKSHSGSRLLAAAMQRLGVFLGDVLNESLDSLPMLPLIEHVVSRHHPDFTLWRRNGSDADVGRLLDRALDAHFAGRPRSTVPWGWKLCETVYALPVVEAAFPGARYIHLIRDGRDVAFCDHAVPDTPFWKKVFFGTDRIMAWRGRRLGFKDYHRQSHVFNAAHWCASVGLGRTYGALLGPRYMEVRYEDLCHRFHDEMARIAAFVGIPPCAELLAPVAATVSTRSIGKYRDRPARALREVLEIETPLLLSLGYLEVDPFTRPPRSLRRRLTAWWPGSNRRQAA